MKKANKNVFPLLLLSNLFPLYGVIREEWPFFLVLYIFWFEMLLSTFFDLLRMYYSALGEKGWDKFRKMFSYLIVRTGIFCFYLIFIVVFMGLLGTSREQHLIIFQAIGFQNAIFNIAILNYAAYNFLNFLFNFVLNKKYMQSQPSDHYHILEARQIVVHVVVVLGAFLSTYVLKHSGNNFLYSNIALVVLFIIVKSIADFITSRPTDEESPEVYI